MTSSLAASLYRYVSIYPVSLPFPCSKNKLFIARLPSSRCASRGQQGTITLEVGANGLLTRHAPQAFGWLIAYGQHLLDYQGMRLDGGMLARTRMAWQNVG